MRQHQRQGTPPSSLMLVYRLTVLGINEMAFARVKNLYANLSLNMLPCTKSTGPSPLKIVPTQPTSDI